jgi:competence protein ComGC
MALARPGQKKTITREHGRAILEAVLVVIFIGVVLMAALDRYYAAIRPLKEAALTIEISNLRRAVNLYVMINKRRPSSLRQLLAEKALLAKKDIESNEYRIMMIGSYVEGMTADLEGYPLDPFGGRYSYDPETGMVHPSTRGYESW